MVAPPGCWQMKSQPSSSSTANTIPTMQPHGSCCYETRVGAPMQMSMPRLVTRMDEAVHTQIAWDFECYR